MTASPFSSARIAPLLEEQAFDLPTDPPLVTTEGRPWVRWANLGSCSGWYALGTRYMDESFDDTGEPFFWESVCRLASEVGNGRIDACHCLGSGVLSVGGLGLTVVSGLGVALLGRCLTAVPLHWVASMAPAIHASGTYLKVSSEGVDNVVLEHVEQGRIERPEHFDGAIRGGSTSERWTGAQKRLSRIWVESVSRTLSHPAMDHVHAEFCRDHVPRLLGPAEGLLRWPSNGVYDAWMFTKEQQALWVAGMVLAIEDQEQSLRALRDCIQWEPQDARASLRHLRNLGDETTSLYAESFRRRVSHAVRRVQELYRFELGDG